MKKVWAYTISKTLNEEQLQELESLGTKFISEWTAHENKLKADFQIHERHILMVKVDESVYEASGCSIDKLQRKVKEFEKQFGIELLNRLLIPAEIKGQLRIIKSSEVRSLLQSGEVNPDTLVYNTAISSEEELKTWKLPLRETWLRKYLETDSQV